MLIREGIFARQASKRRGLAHGVRSFCSRVYRCFFCAKVFTMFIPGQIPAQSQLRTGVSFGWSFPMSFSLGL